VIEILKKALIEEEADIAREKWAAVDGLRPGMTLGKTIYLDSGKPLMPQWLQLNAKLIESLKKNP